MNDAYLLIGGNMGDRMEMLNEATNRIQKSCGVVSKRSSVYRTAAWGYTDQPDFYNQCILLQTEMNADILMQRLLQIETELGRVRTEKMGPRSIDIDILLFNEETVKTEIVEIPHPRLHLRRFALIPLQEIAPSVIHTVLQKTATELLTECTDELDVHKI